MYEHFGSKRKLIHHGAGKDRKIREIGFLTFQWEQPP